MHRPCIQFLLYRFSDNCASQFKSRWTMGMLLDTVEANQLDCSVVHWCYYEPDHGRWRRREREMWRKKR